MTENLYTPNCIRTYSGKYFNPCDPDSSLIEIEDIAHALSMQVRFGGHLPTFYSVAQHSVLTRQLVKPDPKLELTALMHDASEAYLIDVPRPVKEQLSNYKEIEDRLMKVIAEKFGFIWPFPPEVKDADEKMLRNEWEAIKLQNKNWPPIECWDQKTSKRIFLVDFCCLTR